MRCCCLTFSFAVSSSVPHMARALSVLFYAHTCIKPLIKEGRDGSDMAVKGSFCSDVLPSAQTVSNFS